MRTRARTTPIPSSGSHPKAAAAHRALLLLSLVGTAHFGSLHAQESLADLAPFREGCRALAAERFEAAVESFLECWSQLPPGDSGGPEENFVAARLLESFVRKGSGDRALAWLADHPRFRPGPAASFWIAAASEAAARHSEAAKYYQAYLSASPGARPDIRIAMAYNLSRSGEPEAAWALVADLAEQPRLGPGPALRLAEVAANASRDREALALLEGIEGAAYRLARARLRSRVLQRNDRFGEALEEVRTLLAASRHAEEARQAFLLLEALADGAKRKDLAEQVAIWDFEEGSPASRVAELLRSALAPAGTERNGALRAFAERCADAAVAAEARLRLDPPETPEDAAALPSDLRERAEFAAIDAAFRTGDFPLARSIAEGAGGRVGEQRARAVHNAAMAALAGGEGEAFLALEAELGRSAPDSALSVSVALAGALAYARRGEATAFDRLASFVRNHPDHPARADALLALAGMHLNEAPARTREAREIFATLHQLPLGLAQSERLDYDEIWAARIEGASAELLQRAEDFVANWPNSHRLPDVLMILGMEQERRQSSGEASATFARVAADFLDSPLAGKARFYQAKVSNANDGAEEKWRRLSVEGGPFAHEATHELALLLLSLDRFDEAKSLLSELLERLEPNSPMRFAVLADLGHASYLEALAADRDPALLDEAARRFASLSQLSEAPAFWRFNAAVRRGKCLEARDNASVALEIYRSIVDESKAGSDGAPSTLDPGTRQWVFRAGFAAIGILEERENWPAAIEVADALAEKSGPRAIEAARLAQRLRLQHWVWD